MDAAHTDRCVREARNRFLIGFGRMAKGVNVKAAPAEIEGIGRNLASAYPLTNQNFAPVVMTYNEFYLGPMVSIIFETMLVAVGMISRRHPSLSCFAGSPRSNRYW